MKVKIDANAGVLAFTTLEVISVLIIFASSLFSGALQAILFLAGTVLLWYFSHSLSHYFFARFFGVRTLYFYLGKSELRNVKSSFSTVFSRYLLTIGTRLDRKRFASLSRDSRALVMGSGAIVSTILSLLALLYALVGGFGILALSLGSIFFVANLATEIFFGTKAGDLKKMRNELNYQA